MAIARRVRIHLTNIRGTGATRLTESLLPALLGAEGFCISKIYTPVGSPFSAAGIERGVEVAEVRRRLPNALSRLLECMFFGHQYAGDEPLLVLGDLPIRGVGQQTVFVQTPHLVIDNQGGTLASRLKYFLARWVFKTNQRYVKYFVVQTHTMRSSLVRQYPEIDGRVYVVPQPAPSWVLTSGLRRTARRTPGENGLTLFYPAFGYPHKNHLLLADINRHTAERWPVQKLTLTVPAGENPNPQVPWIDCVGLLNPAAVLSHYRDCDALLFLSTAESYGLPLVEAMFIGLPIVCPDLPYARDLCGEQALYFDPHSVSSLLHALVTLKTQLAANWWPNWSGQLHSIPTAWTSVAAQMLHIASGGLPNGLPANGEKPIEAAV
jgi:glycosyltransferase involved in cell wall biosynthesis